MRIRNLILALICLVACWYYALSLASIGGIGLRPGFANDFGPIWNVSRAMLHRIDPYSKEVTEQNQIAEYGTKAKTIGVHNDQIFPYPVVAAFPFLLLGLLSWRVADFFVFYVFTSLVGLSVGWLRKAWDGTTLLYVILALGSYPIVSTIEMRQPTIFFFGLGVASLALLRAGHYVAAGMVASLVAGKPQVTASLLLPMLIWTLAKWPERRRFAVSFFASVFALLCASLIVVPGWIPHWFAALHSYSLYVQPSLPVIVLGKRAGLVVSILLGLGTIASLWLHRQRDLLFQVAFCATMFYLITQFVVWNSILLLLPAIWVADNSKLIERCGTASQIALTLVRASFVGLWLGAPIGALLLHTDAFGVKLAWLIPEAMLFPLFLSLLALMTVNAVSVYPSGPMMTVAEAERNGGNNNACMNGGLNYEPSRDLKPYDLV